MSSEHDQSAFRGDPRRHRRALLLAVLIVLILQSFVPYGHLILYPFTLLSTWVHEMGHGVTAILCGGRFERLEIFADGSGLAHTAVRKGACQALTAAGGLLAPPLIGGVMLALAGRLARGLLWMLALSILISLILWVRSGIGWLAMVPLWLLIVVCARHGGQGGRLYLAKLTGVLLGLDTLMRIGYFFVPVGQVGGVPRPSDMAGIAGALGGPYQLWGALLAGCSLVLLFGGLAIAWRGWTGDGLTRRGSVARA